MVYEVRNNGSDQGCGYLEEDGSCYFLDGIILDKRSQRFCRNGSHLDCWMLSMVKEDVDSKHCCD